MNIKHTTQSFNPIWAGLFANLKRMGGGASRVGDFLMSGIRICATDQG